MSSKNAQNQIPLNKGIVQIYIPKTTYFNNEYIEGQVYINTKKEFREFTAMIQQEGTEETYFSQQYYVNQNEDQVIETINSHGKNKFLNYTQSIYDSTKENNSNPNLLKPGEWKIPFTLQIETTLPPSFSQIYDQNKCDIKYKLIVFLISSNQNNIFLEGQKEIEIRQQKDLQSSEIFKIGRLHFKIDDCDWCQCCCCYCCFFCYYRYIRIQAKLEKSVYQPNEVIIVITIK